MEEMREKLTLFLEALDTLQEGIELFDEYQIIVNEQPSIKNEKLLKSIRDSLIQRFEYCVDLLWKVIKNYLGEVEKITLSANSPRGMIREGVKARILSESEGDECMQMIELRNKTSHTYHEDMAEEIAHQVPAFYRLMQKITDRMQEKLR